MNHWARMLRDLPPTAQRRIARTHRVSLPRGCAAAERHHRLRIALCRARAVRATYFALPPDAQAALQHLRACPRGITPPRLLAQYGPLRPWSHLAADPTPQTMTERLVLLGWLLPRPATPRHPARFLLPPELRAWLPRPLQLPDHGAAPAAPLPLAVRAATTILLAAAKAPLPVRATGMLRAAVLRQLQPRLAPLPPAEATALCQFLLPLLRDLGLLAPHGVAAALAPGGQRFLGRSPRQQLQQLRQAWEHAPRPDASLMALLTDRRGIDWPCLRRRLMVWAATLPVGRLLDPQALFPALQAALGPLADAQTHGLRSVPRAPWQGSRAAAVWDAALRGPLRWLGRIAWIDGPALGWCFVPPLATATIARDASATVDPDDGWQYGAVGVVRVPHTARGRAVLPLLVYARWAAADTAATTYHITPQTLAAARRDGHTSATLQTVLLKQAGPLPAPWSGLLDQHHEHVQIVHAAVVTSDTPTVLDRAAQQRSVRRYLGPQLAPGIALVPPERVVGLTRTLTRQHLVVEVHGDPAIAPPAAFTPAECATLVLACRSYRQHRADDALLPALRALEARLQAALPPTLHAPLTGPAAPDAVSSAHARPAPPRLPPAHLAPRRHAVTPPRRARGTEATLLIPAATAPRARLVWTASIWCCGACSHGTEALPSSNPPPPMMDRIGWSTIGSWWPRLATSELLPYMTRLRRWRSSVTRLDGGGWCRFSTPRRTTWRQRARSAHCGWKGTATTGISRPTVPWQRPSGASAWIASATSAS